MFYGKHEPLWISINPSVSSIYKKNLYACTDIVIRYIKHFSIRNLLLGEKVV